MGKKLTEQEVKSILADNKTVEVCSVCEGSEPEFSQNAIDPNGMSWDAVCDECQDSGMLTARYTHTYLQLNGIKPAGYGVYEDGHAGSIYFHKRGTEYSVYATPNWEDSKVVPVELIDSSGNVEVLGQIGLQGTLQEQMNRYIHIMQRFLEDAENIANSLVV